MCVCGGDNYMAIPPCQKVEGIYPPSPLDFRPCYTDIDCQVCFLQMYHLQYVFASFTEHNMAGYSRAACLVCRQNTVGKNVEAWKLLPDKYWCLVENLGFLYINT